MPNDQESKQSQSKVFSYPPSQGFSFGIEPVAMQESVRENRENRENQHVCTDTENDWSQKFVDIQRNIESAICGITEVEDLQERLNEREEKIIRKNKRMIRRRKNLDKREGEIIIREKLLEIRRKRLRGKRREMKKKIIDFQMEKYEQACREDSFQRMMKNVENYCKKKRRELGY